METQAVNREPRGVFLRVLSFSLPYLLSCLMQTLYGMADLFIIGQFDGVASTTAVSIGSQVMHMITVVIVALTMGTTVLIGKSVGRRERALTSRAVGNTVTLFACLAACATVGLLLAVRPIVGWMSTPAEAYGETCAYLTVCFSGIPFITAYNVISAIFRGMGNSKTPMYFVAVACVSNIALDLFLIGVLDLGAVGAALGTTLSQGISVLLALLFMRRLKTGFSMKKSDLRPRRAVMGELLRVGVPVALQDGFIQIAFLLVTLFANQRGMLDAAAVGIVEKVIGILMLVPSAMLSTTSALCAQYIGAKEEKLARMTLRCTVLLSVAFGSLSVLAMQFGAEWLVGCFTDEAAVALMGGQYMRGYVWDCMLAGIHFCFSGYFCACKHSGISFLHNCIAILTARVPIAYWASKTCASLLPMGLASTLGSAVSAAVCLVAYVWLQKNRKKNCRFQPKSGKNCLTNNAFLAIIKLQKRSIL